jgi:hypothetical protein
MPKMRLAITVIVLVGMVIIGEAIYAFTRPVKLDLSQVIVLIGIAVLALFALMITLFLVWRSLNKTEKK